MKIKKRSAHGRGIIDRKLNKKLEDCPFTDEKIAGILKADMWKEGFEALDQYKKIKKDVYEDLT